MQASEQSFSLKKTVEGTSMKHGDLQIMMAIGRMAAQVIADFGTCFSLSIALHVSMIAESVEP
jgi:hypothetical protein